MREDKQREKERQQEEGLTAAGVGLHARETGVLYDEIGRIVVSCASLHGVDAYLWERLRVAVDQLRLVLDLRAVDAMHGRAIAIVKVGPEARIWHRATVENPDAIRLAEYLRVHGFRAGEEGPGPTLRFGPPNTPLNPTAHDHADHLYVSLPRRCSSESIVNAEPTGAQAETAECSSPLALARSLSPPLAAAAGIS